MKDILTDLFSELNDDEASLMKMSYFSVKFLS